MSRLTQFLAANGLRRICKIPGCDHEFVARGLCDMHYARWRAHGDPLVNLHAGHFRSCDVSGCDRPSYVRGWCTMHYGRWRAHGDPLFRVTMPHPDACLIEGCGKPPKGKGYCEMHYRRLRLYGGPLASAGQRAPRLIVPKLIQLGREGKNLGRIPRSMRRPWLQWALSPSPYPGANP